MYAELTGMMSSHLNLVQPQHDQSMPATPQVSPQPAPIAYITRHYHHSAHQVPNSERPISDILEEAGVNASALLPVQILLFKNADEEQQRRLVELWKISPPAPGNQLPPWANTNWPQSNMELEEEAARMRWEALERDRLKNLCALPGYDNRATAEPYMKNLFASATATSAQQTGENKRCKDPVYNHSREWWQMGADAEPMEHQVSLVFRGPSALP